MRSEQLAVNGGPKARPEPLPYRKLFGEDELRAVHEVFEHSWREGVDFGFQGEFEDRYTKAFCDFQGGGYADAVSSGTAAVYVAVMALGLEGGSDVVVSPVTDPGSIAPVILAGLNPVIADSKPGSYNVGVDEFAEALTPNTRAAVLTHAGGHPIEMGPIMDLAESRDIRIIEDCSQAHGAQWMGRKVGCFGHIGTFSTMFSKNHASGGCGGLVFTRDPDLYWRVRSYADRGKPFQNSEADLKDPGGFLFPSLNLNMDELSCAIGRSTLVRLPQTIERRRRIAEQIDDLLGASVVVFPIKRNRDAAWSPFFHTVGVRTERLSVSKLEFGQAVAAEGIWVNPHYRYVASEWTWLKPCLRKEPQVPNAVSFRDNTLNILFNEKFTDADIEDIAGAVLKVESVYGR